MRVMILGNLRVDNISAFFLVQFAAEPDHRWIHTWINQVENYQNK